MIFNITIGSIHFKRKVWKHQDESWKGNNDRMLQSALKNCKYEHRTEMYFHLYLLCNLLHFVSLKDPVPNVKSSVEFPPLIQSSRRMYHLPSSITLQKFITKKGWKKCNASKYIGFQVFTVISFIEIFVMSAYSRISPQFPSPRLYWMLRNINSVWKATKLNQGSQKHQKRYIEYVEMSFKSL